MKTTLLFIFIGLILFPLKVGATEIIDGDLIRAADTLDVYIVKLIGAEKFKRLILNPDIFNQYGHLKWENIKEVTQATIDEFTTSQVVRASGDTRVYKLYPQHQEVGVGVYPNGDAGEKRWIKTANDFLDLGYDWNAIYTINTYERDFYALGLDLEAPQAPQQPSSEEPTIPSRDPITINVPTDYSTISAALNASINGDTISIKAGTYNENIIIDKNITLIGESVGNTIIDGKGIDNAITISAGKNILIQKLTITSANKDGIYCFGSPEGGSEDNLVTATFKNNIIKDSGWGMVAENNCQLTVLNNLIYNNKNSANADGSGILIKDNFSYSITSEIRNNTIDGNYHGIWSENSNLKVINNIVSSNIGGKGTVDSTGTYHSGTGVSDNTYNNVWGNGYEYNGNAMAGNGSINVDPRFVSAPTRDYRLKTGTIDFSPCLDAGHPDVIYWDATYSSNTTRNDMGAYGGPENINW